MTRFQKGDYIMRKGEAATFLAILLQGELGVASARAAASHGACTRARSSASAACSTRATCARRT